MLFVGIAGVVERLRRRPILLLAGVAMVLVYVTPFYYQKTPFVPFPLICKNATCHQASSLALWEEEDVPPEYVVYNSPGCRIMEMDPFGPDVRRFLKKGKRVHCSQQITTLDGQRLRFDPHVLKTWSAKRLNCCYRTIHRQNQSLHKYNRDADWLVKYSDECHHIPVTKEGLEVNESFIKVECQGSGKMKGAVEFQGVVLPPQLHSPATRAKAEFWETRRAEGLTEQPPNILIVGIDSISRMHLIRSLPHTKSFLSENDFVELKGYNKVGENTFPNIMAGFGGMELYKYPCWPNKSVSLDGCQFVWSNFSDLQYTTGFLEDAPGIAIFNYAKYGFVLPPADYYMRPLTVAMHKHYNWDRSSGKAGCVGGRSPTDFQAHFMSSLVANGVRQQIPLFLFSWFTSIGHDDFNGLGTGDDTFLELLRSSLDPRTGDPNNTVVIFMSDHGYRFGSFRETFLGFYEESLPFFFVRLPPALRAKYPHWEAQLRRNAHQLTSPLDLYATLNQLLFYAQSIVKQNVTRQNSSSSANETLADDGEKTFNMTEERDELETPWWDLVTRSSAIEPQFRSRYSFFEFIPPNRTCEVASIPQRYCMCGVTPAVSPSSSLSSRLGDIVVGHLNYLLEASIRKGLCTSLRFSKFMYGREVGHGEVWNNFHQLLPYKDYLVALEATPSKGHFEAKLRLLQNSTTRILGDITRINSYKGQSDCIHDSALKPFCFCNDKKPLLKKMTGASIFALFSSSSSKVKTPISTKHLKSVATGNRSGVAVAPAAQRHIHSLKKPK